MVFSLQKLSWIIFLCYILVSFIICYTFVAGTSRKTIYLLDCGFVWNTPTPKDTIIPTPPSLADVCLTIKI